MELARKCRLNNWENYSYFYSLYELIRWIFLSHISLIPSFDETETFGGGPETRDPFLRLDPGPYR